MTPLLDINDQGTIVLVWPLTDEARDWLEEHTDGTWWGGALCVEPRYVQPLIEGLYDDLV